MVRRALLNLVLNALDAMPEGGDLVITSYDGAGALKSRSPTAGRVSAKRTSAASFEPFYTTKQHGTGLGLAVVYHVAEAHGGNVTATNCPEGGAAFTIRFPRKQMRAAA